MIHAVNLSRRAGGRYGVLPYQEFHEANLDPQVEDIRGVLHEGAIR